MNAGRRVIGAETIAEARRHTRQKIEILPGDIVTAEAWDQAERLGIVLVKGPLQRPQFVKTDGSVALRRGLWRRGPRWVAPSNRISPIARRFGKIAFVGVGGIGTNAAHLCANSDMAEELTLIDITPGLAEATALDLNHATGVTRSRAYAGGGTSLALVEGADLVLVTAGKARTPGMSRTDLMDINRRVIQSVGQAIATYAPQAIVLVVTNPLDEMVVEMLRATGFLRHQVLGMAGTLDSSRFRNALARAAGVALHDVEALTLGSHGDEMVPIVSASRIKGRSVEVFLSQDQIAACVDATIGGGGQVVALKKTGSAVLAPAHASVEVMDYIRGARAGTVPVSVLLQGEYGVHDVVLGVPCHLGLHGLIAVEEKRLADSELQSLRLAAEAIRSRLVM